MLARSPRLRIALAVLASVALVAGVSWEVLRGGGEPGHRRSITEHAGTLHWSPRGPDPDPALGERYWTSAYPAAYAPRVRTGVGIYWKNRRIGFVVTRRVDEGTVWVYAWIAPEEQAIAAASIESEPIETGEGPRIIIYRVSAAPSPSAPPGAPATEA